MPTCLHGFPQDECLICKTLGTGRAPAAKARTDSGGSAASASRTVAGTTLASPVLAPRRSDALEGRLGPDGRRGRRRARRGLWTVAAALVIGGLFVWLFAGLFSLAFHVGEYVALALVAGWVGYKLGFFNGRRHGHAT